MLIESLHLRHFRSHVDTQVDGLGPVNLFLGPMEAGKSSLLDAMCVAFTGTCRGTDEAGRGADSLITIGSGAPTFGVMLRLRKDGAPQSIVRSSTDGPRSPAQRGIDTTFGWSGDVLRALFRPDSFLSLPAGDQAALVASMAAPASIRAIVREALTVDGRCLLEEDLLPDRVDHLDPLEARCRDGRKRLKDAVKNGSANETVLKNLPEALRTAPLPAMLEQKVENDQQRQRLELEMGHLDKKKETAAPATTANEPLTTANVAIAQLRAAVAVSCPHCLKESRFVIAQRDLMTVAGVADALRRLESERQKAEQPKLPEKAEPDPNAMRRTKLAEMIASLKARSAEIDRAVFVRESAETEAKALEVTRTRLNVAEQVCTLLAPKGKVRAAVLAAGQQGGGFDFTAAVNRVLAWGGWGSVVIHPSPWQIVRDGVAAGLLSASARWRLNFAIQVAIAEASGVRVVVLDGADIITHGATGALVEAACNAVRDGLVDQVFVLASRDLAEIPARAPDGFKVYVVDQSEGRSAVWDLDALRPTSVPAEAVQS